ncbi:hypothetical protein SAMN02745121_02591 [Nannocystis exedens]|uniref:Uncharacterized protein n=1 Tax=Nannocystis exedens TaxID=54 RepID=A0A1I1X201_9BACT|nr:hypothetical protein [Nannocystis exedens]PCC70942.1 hypothetical protein NAEX_04008 [Nannocystis exedens]SFD99713.1 hypothetical protein SAMN02745121_02591 [Nannocystis exedens]
MRARIGLAALLAAPFFGCFSPTGHLPSGQQPDTTGDGASTSGGPTIADTTSSSAD